jgi:hypothetical protein
VQRPRALAAFLFLVFLALAVTVGWWMLVGGGIHVLVHDFSPASIPRTR